MLPWIILPHAPPVSVWGLMVSLGAAAVLWLGRVNARGRSLPVEPVERLWPWLILGGFAGAHLYHLVAVSGWPLRAVPAVRLFNIFEGTAVQGGFLGGLCVAAIGLRRERRPPLPFLDALAPAGALAQAFTRLGCFAAGCCYGRPTRLFLGAGLSLHPAQLYEAVLDALLAFLLQRGLERRREPGTSVSVYLMGAGLIRFFVQFFRGDDDGRLVAGLAHSQFTALAMLAAGAALFVRLRRREVTV